MARAALAGLFVCVLALTGCAALADLGQLREDLESAGYDATSIDHDTTNGYAELSIDVSSADEPTYAEAEEVGRIAWRTFDGEIDRMHVTINGSFGFAETYDELLVHYGERPESLPADDDVDSPLTLILVVVGVAVVFAALMVLLWHRGRRSTPPVAQPGHQPGGHAQYPPQPPQG